MLMSRSISVTHFCVVLWESPSCQRPGAGVPDVGQSQAPPLRQWARAFSGELPRQHDFFAVLVGADDVRAEFARAAVIAAHDLLLGEDGVAEEGIGGAGHWISLRNGRLRYLGLRGGQSISIEIQVVPPGLRAWPQNEIVPSTCRRRTSDGYGSTRRGLPPATPIRSACHFWGMISSWASIAPSPSSSARTAREVHAAGRNSRARRI